MYVRGEKKEEEEEEREMLERDIEHPEVPLHRSVEFFHSFV